MEIVTKNSEAVKKLCKCVTKQVIRDFHKFSNNLQAIPSTQLNLQPTTDIARDSYLCFL